MEINKTGNKFSFGIGVLLFLGFGFTILRYGFDIKAGLGFLIGFYNIWQNGFYRDSSSWKLKPIFVLGVSLLILLGSYVLIDSKELNSIGFSKGTKSKLIDQIAQDAKTLPIHIGNGDSIIGLRLINNHTLEYKYKLNMKVFEIPSFTLADFNIDTKETLLNKINNNERETISEWRKNRISFHHIFFDRSEHFITTIKINSGEY